jgi:hypothetical protein
LEEVSKEELGVVLHSFKKEQNPRLDDWLIDLSTSFINCIGEDLLRVAEEFGDDRKMLVSFNSTFITLIPKINNLTTFE